MEINNIKVKSDDGGLYLMRDLFEASGMPQHKNPSVFLRQAQTQKLQSVIGGGGVSRKMGKFGGVYASKEIVIAYAMWLSAEFYLKVIKTFLNVAEGNLDAAAIEADTEASRAAAVKVGMAYIEHDRFVFSDKDKAIELLKSADVNEETMKDRIKRNAKVELTNISSKRVKTSELITGASRACAYKHGVTDSSIVFECYNEMVEDGLIVTDGAYAMLIK